MYSDPSLIRRHTVKLSLSDREAALIDAFCAYTGEEKAPMLRELVLQRAVEVLGHMGNSGAAPYEMPRLQQSQFAA
jgi:hypothetical protein